MNSVSEELNLFLVEDSNRELVEAFNTFAEAKSYIKEIDPDNEIGYTISLEGSENYEELPYRFDSDGNLV